MKFITLNRKKPTDLQKADYNDLCTDLQLVSRIIKSTKEYHPATLNQVKWLNGLYVSLLIYKEQLNAEINRRIELIPTEKLINDLPILKTLQL